MERPEYPVLAVRLCPLRSVDVHEATRRAQMRLLTMSDGALNRREGEMETGSCLGGQNTTGSLTPTSPPHTRARALHTHTHLRISNAEPFISSERRAYIRARPVLSSSLLGCKIILS